MAPEDMPARAAPGRAIPPAAALAAETATDATGAVLPGGAAPQALPSASGLFATLRRDVSLSAVLAGFLAVVISYSGPLLIFLQAGHAAGVSDAMLSSWIWAISLGAGMAGIWLSWRLKMPVITAWSAPGTALLVTLFPAMPLGEAIGAYLLAGVAVALIGWSGAFDRLMRHIPPGIAAGMMAGILFQFGANAFRATASQPLPALAMLAAYLLGKRHAPRHAVMLVLLAGVLAALLSGQADVSTVRLAVAQPQWIAPQWSWRAAIGFALPLLLVSLSGQFLPGLAILKLAGYRPAARAVMGATGLASVAVAWFGGITIVIASITAALCTGRDAHEDPGRRYVAGLANGLFYIIGGMLAGTIVALFAALPRELVAVLAGLALLGAIGANLAGAVADERHREASVITFIATASGMGFLGLGAAFWGIVFGMGAHGALAFARKPG
jgi:benzoate membrane transport protein